MTKPTLTQLVVQPITKLPKSKIEIPRRYPRKKKKQGKENNGIRKKKKLITIINQHIILTAHSSVTAIPRAERQTVSREKNSKTSTELTKGMITPTLTQLREWRTKKLSKSKIRNSKKIPLKPKHKIQKPHKAT